MPVPPKTGVEKRAPRQNESIQAFSLNGSPLGRGIAEPAAVPEPVGLPELPEFTFRAGLPDHLAKALREQLGATAMDPVERARLEERLLSLFAGDA